MPRSRYPRPGHAIAPRLLSDFLKRQAPFGAGRFCDLGSDVWTRFDSKTCKRLGLALVAELSKNVLALAAAVGHLKMPCPTDPVLIDDLELETRTFSCLRQADADNLPGRVGSLTIGQALSLRGFGIKSLIDLLTSLESLADENGRAPPRQTQPRLASAQALIPDDFVNICRRAGRIPEELLDCTLPPLPHGVTLSDLNLPLRSFNALSRAGYAENPERLRFASIRDLTKVYGLGEKSLFALVDAVQQSAMCGASLAQKMTVDEEILRLFAPSRDSRRRAIIASHFGLEGHSRSTLETVGKKFNITRERVRQICTPGHISKVAAPPPAPLLDYVLEMIRSRVPAPARDVEAELASAGLLQKKTRIENIIEVATLLKRSPGFVVDTAGSAGFVAEAKTMEHIRRIAALTGKVVAKYGVAKLDDIRARATELLKTSFPTSVVDSVIQSCAGFRWVDETAGYFWLNNGRHNMLRRRIRRVLSVAPRIPVGELRAAIRRDHRYEGQAPPTRILLDWCQQLSECRVDGSDVVAVDPDYPLDILKGDERVIIGLLLDQGPVCQREKLQKLAMDAGVGLPSFWRCVSFCPTITRYARGVFGLTGAKVLPGEVESLIRPIPKNEVLQDHGWTADGKVWIAYRLSENSVETGVFGVPAAKREYIQGEFGLTTAPENAGGTLVVKGSSVWGLGGYLSKNGAETGDILVIEISSKDKCAVARLGDDTLLDEMLSGY
jgi:hypothetical protein